MAITIEYFFPNSTNLILFQSERKACLTIRFSGSSLEPYALQPEQSLASALASATYASGVSSRLVSLAWPHYGSMAASVKSRRIQTVPLPSCSNSAELL